MATLRIDKGEETVQFIEGVDRRSALIDFRLWLDEMPVEEIDGIEINRSNNTTYKLTFSPLAVWDGPHAYTYDQFVDARNMLISRAAQGGDHWVA